MTTKLSTVSLGIASIFALYVAVTYSVPFSLNVDLESVIYHDMCVGDQLQLVTAQRTVFPPYGVPASVRGELFYFEDSFKLETINKRNADFTYQKSDEPVTYEILWDNPVTREGVYGASDFVTINPFPLIYKSKYFSEDDQTFNVINCDV